MSLWANFSVLQTLKVCLIYQFLIFVFSTVNNCSIKLPMLSFEPGSSNVRNNLSDNCATITAALSVRLSPSSTDQLGWRQALYPLQGPTLQLLQWVFPLMVHSVEWFLEYFCQEMKLKVFRFRHKTFLSKLIENIKKNCTLREEIDFSWQSESLDLNRKERSFTQIIQV